MFIDTHCHVTKEYYNNLDSIIKKMGNNLMIINGVDTETNKEIIGLCNKYNNVYGALGIHPEKASNYSDLDLEFIEKNINHPKIVAVGEIGLDYYYTKDNIEIQIDLFKKQIDIAKKNNKPIIVHSRDSIEDTYNVLKKSQDSNLKIVLHCYNSSLEMAERFVKIGALIGIGGVVTFKNGKKLVEVVKNLDLEHLLLETDSPFLAPDPLRGTINEPSNVKIIAEKIAEIKGIKAKEVIKITTLNAFSQFDLKAKN